MTVGKTLVAAGAGISLTAGVGSQVGLYALNHPRDPYPDANIGLAFALMAGSAASIGAGVPALVGAQFVGGPTRGIATAAAVTGLLLGGHVAYTGYRNAMEGR